MKKRDYVFSMFGAFLMAFAVGNVLEPMQLVTGGVSGLAIIIKEYTQSMFMRMGWLTNTFLSKGIPLWLTSVVFNVPLFLVAFRIMGGAFLRRSLWGAFWLTFFLGVIPMLNILPRDYVLNTLFGGIIEGLGLGIVLLSKGSTGGGDLLATILHKFFSQYSIPQIVAVLDAFVVGLGILSFGIQKGLYAFVVIYLVSRISDGVIAGFGRSLMTFVVSDNAEPIAHAIMQDLQRGITGINVKGIYSGKNRTMLLCVTNRKQLVYIKEIVAKYDKKAFVIVTEARETLGEGFYNLGNNTL